MELTTKFDRGQSVSIVELKRTGVVKAIYFDDAGLSYSVRYFDGADAKTVVFYEHELQPATSSPNGATGFKHEENKT